MLANMYIMNMKRRDIIPAKSIKGIVTDMLAV